MGVLTRRTPGWCVVALLASVLQFSRDTLDVIFDSRFSSHTVVLSISVNYFQARKVMFRDSKHMASWLKNIVVNSLQRWSSLLVSSLGLVIVCQGLY